MIDTEYWGRGETIKPKGDRTSGIYGIVILKKYKRRPPDNGRGSRPRE